MATAGEKEQLSDTGTKPTIGQDVERSRSAAKELSEGGSNLYEKKCLLGYMVDLMWAQAFGLVLSPLQQELGFLDDQTGNLSTAFSAGLTAGMLCFQCVSVYV